MGDVSIIARRLLDGHVQYGWSGNGGCLDTRGVILNTLYDTPELVDYLFSLGQLELIGEPHSERKSHWYRNRPTGKPHWLGNSERDVFSKIAFVDYCYFYETREEKWYFVNHCSAFIVKLPLSWCIDYMMSYTPNDDDRLDQGKLMHELNSSVLLQFLDKYDSDAEFKKYCDSVSHCDGKVKITPETVDNFRTIVTKYRDDDYIVPIFDMCRNILFEDMTRYYDYWTIYDTEADKIIFRRRTADHVETINWRNRNEKT